MADDHDDDGSMRPMTPEERERAKARLTVHEGGKAQGARAGNGAAKPAPAAKAKGKKAKANVALLARELRDHPDIQDLIGYDTFRARVVRLRPVPGAKDQSPEIRPWEDEDEIALQIWFQENGYPDATDKQVSRAVKFHASGNQFSSAVRHMLALPEWDGLERVKRFFRVCCGVELTGDTVEEMQAQQSFLHELGTCLFVGIVSRMFKPGCQFDLVVILEGEQGTFKSSLCRMLAQRDEWFSDRLPRNLDHKDTSAHLKNRSVLEMAELAVMKGDRLEELKAFITARTEQKRFVYASNETEFQRQCVFIGTTNKTSNYLSDVTGNRRFIPVRCGKIDLDWMKANRDQLFAEAMILFESGAPCYLSPKALEYAKGEQEARAKIDPWELLVRIYLDGMWRAEVSNQLLIKAEIVMRDAIKTDAGRWTFNDRERVCDILRKLGGDYGQHGGRNDRTRYFRFQRNERDVSTED